MLTNHFATSGIAAATAAAAAAVGCCRWWRPTLPCVNHLISQTPSIWINGSSQKVPIFSGKTEIAWRSRHSFVGRNRYTDCSCAASDIAACTRRSVVFVSQVLRGARWGGEHQYQRQEQLQSMNPECHPGPGSRLEPGPTHALPTHAQATTPTYDVTTYVPVDTDADRDYAAPTMHQSYCIRPAMLDLPRQCPVCACVCVCTYAARITCMMNSARRARRAGRARGSSSLRTRTKPWVTSPPLGYSSAR